LAVDDFCKQLARRHPDALAGWLQGLLGPAPHPVPSAIPWQLLDRELPAASQQADTVILSGHGLILHAEFQARPDPLMPERMLEYWIRLHRLYGRPIQQVVLYLKRTRSLRARIDRLEIGATSHGYAVVRLWEQPAGPLLAAPELLPLATLARSTPATQPPLLAQVAERLSRISDPDRRRALYAGCHLLAGLAFSQLTIDTHLPMSILEQSVTYQAAIRRGEQKGLENGLAKGLQQGLEQGLQQGLEHGRQVEAAALALRLLGLRLGPVPAATEATIGAMPLVQLEALVEALLAFNGLEDLAAWLEQNQP
jgi:predicted transposase YdaD